MAYTGTVYDDKKGSLIKRLSDKLMGISYVNNETNPSSALSQMRRKNANQPSPNMKQNPVGRNSSGQGVGM